MSYRNPVGVKNLNRIYVGNLDLADLLLIYNVGRDEENSVSIGEIADLIGSGGLPGGGTTGQVLAKASDTDQDVEWITVSGGGISGLTTGTLPKASSSTSLVDSIMSESSTTITVAGTLAATALTGALTGNVTGNVSGTSGSTTGNAATATALATARAINGTNFDGTAPITVTAAAETLTGTTLNATVVASSLTSVGTLSSLTVGGLLLTTLSGTGGAMFRLPHGAAPTSPTNGDTWTTTAGLYVRINGTTVGPLAAAGAGTIGVADEGSTVVASATSLNFVGSGVSASDAGGGVATITISGALNTTVHAFGNSTGAKTFDYSSYQAATLTLTGDVTLTISGALASGNLTELTYIETGDGTHQVTVAGLTVTWVNGTPPVLANAAVRTVQLVSTDGSTALGFYTPGAPIVNADISATAGIVDTKLATISTAGKVSNSATTAASANTASAIVARDSSGNFSAGTITASLTGNISGTAPAGSLTGTTLNATVVTSSLTSVGSLTGLTMAGAVVGADQDFKAMVIRDASYNASAPTISAGTLALDYTAGPYFYVSLDANISTITWSNWPPTGKNGVAHIIFTADGTQRTITGAQSTVTVKWDSATQPTPPATSGHDHVWTIISKDALTTIRGFLGAQNMS